MTMGWIPLCWIMPMYSLQNMSVGFSGTPRMGPLTHASPMFESLKIWEACMGPAYHKGGSHWESRVNHP